MKDFALRFLEYFGIGAEELSKMTPIEQMLLELIPLVLGIGFILGVFLAVSGFGKREVQTEEDKSELDKEIELIRSLQRR